MGLLWLVWHDPVLVSLYLELGDKYGFRGLLGYSHKMEKRSVVLALESKRWGLAAATRKS